MSQRSEWNDLAQAVSAAGWKTRRCAHGTLVYPADRKHRPVTMPGTPGEYRSIRNCRAQLRRAGLLV